MKILFLALFAAAAAMSRAEIAAYDVTSADKAFLLDVLAAVEKRDAAWIARHTLLPVAVGSGKKRRIVRSEIDFRKILERSISLDLAKRMQADAKDPLFKNWRGVMLGDGILWFTECRESDKKPWRYAILAIGDFAFQPNDGKGLIRR